MAQTCGLRDLRHSQPQCAVLHWSNASTHVSKEKGIMASIRTYAAWVAAFLLEAIEAAATDDAER